MKKLLPHLLFALLVVGCDDDGEVILHPIVGVWDVEKIAYQNIDISDNELAGFFILRIKH